MSSWRRLRVLCSLVSANTSKVENIGLLVYDNGHVSLKFSAFFSSSHNRQAFLFFTK